MVPPLKPTVASPSQLPKQEIFVLSIMEAANTAGSDKVTVARSTQPLASVTVTVTRTPAHSPATVAFVCVGPVLHEYVYGVVPPEGVAVASPSHKPLQLMLVLSVIVTVRTVGSVITAESTMKHPVRSLMVSM